MLSLEGRVAQRPEDRVVVDERITALPEVMRGARPAVVGGIGGQARMHGGQFDVPQAGKQEAPALEHRVSIAAFPHRARAAMPAVEGADIAATEALHHAPEGVGHLRRRQQEHLVVDERVAMQGDLVACGRLPKRGQEPLAIGVVQRERLAIVRPMNDQMRVPRDTQARQPGHSGDLIPDSGPINAGR